MQNKLKEQSEINEENKSKFLWEEHRISILSEKLSKLSISGDMKFDNVSKSAKRNASLNNLANLSTIYASKSDKMLHKNPQFFENPKSFYLFTESLLNWYQSIDRNNLNIEALLYMNQLLLKELKLRSETNLIINVMSLYLNLFGENNQDSLKLKIDLSFKSPQKQLSTFIYKENYAKYFKNNYLWENKINNPDKSSNTNQPCVSYHMTAKSGVPCSVIINIQSYTRQYYANNSKKFCTIQETILTHKPTEYMRQNYISYLLNALCTLMAGIYISSHSVRNLNYISNLRDKFENRMEVIAEKPELYFPINEAAFKIKTELNMVEAVSIFPCIQMPRVLCNFIPKDFEFNGLKIHYEWRNTTTFPHVATIEKSMRTYTEKNSVISNRIFLVRMKGYQNGYQFDLNCKKIKRGYLKYPSNEIIFPQEDFDKFQNIFLNSGGKVIDSIESEKRTSFESTKDEICRDSFTQRYEKFENKLRKIGATKKMTNNSFKQVIGGETENTFRNLNRNKKIILHQVKSLVSKKKKIPFNGNFNMNSLYYKNRCKSKKSKDHAPFENYSCNPITTTVKRKLVNILFNSDYDGSIRGGKLIKEISISKLIDFEFYTSSYEELMIMQGKHCSSTKEKMKNCSSNNNSKVTVVDTTDKSKIFGALKANDASFLEKNLTCKRKYSGTNCEEDLIDSRMEYIKHKRNVNSFKCIEPFEQKKREVCVTIKANELRFFEKKFTLKRKNSEEDYEEDLTDLNIKYTKYEPNANVFERIKLSKLQESEDSLAIKANDASFSVKNLTHKRKYNEKDNEEAIIDPSQKYAKYDPIANNFECMTSEQDNSETSMAIETSNANFFRKNFTLKSKYDVENCEEELMDSSKKYTKHEPNGNNLECVKPFEQDKRQIPVTIKANEGSFLEENFTHKRKNNEEDYEEELSNSCKKYTKYDHNINIYQGDMASDSLVPTDGSMLESIFKKPLKHSSSLWEGKCIVKPLVTLEHSIENEIPPHVEAEVKTSLKRIVGRKFIQRVNERDNKREFRNEMPLYKDSMEDNNCNTKMFNPVTDPLPRMDVPVSNSKLFKNSDNLSESKYNAKLLNISFNSIQIDSNSQKEDARENTLKVIKHMTDSTCNTKTGLFSCKNKSEDTLPAECEMFREIGPMNVDKSKSNGANEKNNSWYKTVKTFRISNSEESKNERNIKIHVSCQTEAPFCCIHNSSDHNTQDSYQNYEESSIFSTRKCSPEFQSSNILPVWRKALLRGSKSTQNQQDKNEIRANNFDWKLDSGNDHQVKDEDEHIVPNCKYNKFKAKVWYIV